MAHDVEAITVGGDALIAAFAGPATPLQFASHYDELI
jgi:hypothetical protein